MLRYEDLTFAEIVDDLEETLNDLHWNAGLARAGSLLQLLDPLNVDPNMQPTERLIEIMNQLYQYDDRLLHEEASKLMGDAVDEIIHIASIHPNSL